MVLLVSLYFCIHISVDRFKKKICVLKASECEKKMSHMFHSSSYVGENINSHKHSRSSHYTYFANTWHAI